jgi:hypothetical protein
MRLFKILSGLLAAVLPLMSSFAHAGSGGTSFELKIKDDRFRLTVKQVFPDWVTLNKARELLSDGNLQASVSNIVRGVQRGEVAGDGKFDLATTTHVFVSVTNTYHCTEQTTSERWKQSCIMDPGNRSNRLAFVNGEGSSAADCAQDPSQGAMVCKLTFAGRPKKILWKSPQQLAAGGAVETIHDLGAVYSAGILGVKPAQAKQGFDASVLGGVAHKMYDEVISRAVHSSLDGQLLILSGSDIDGRFDVQQAQGDL